jgi:hypothetical protein
MMNFKQHALSVIHDCNNGRQRCGECPLLECGDNLSILSHELRRHNIDATACCDRDRQLAGRERRRGTDGD